jgi:GNAT superfamily N-acetyltransferase
VAVETREEPIGLLAEHARIPIGFRVETILDPSSVESGLGGIALRERPVEAPYVKDYDAANDRGPTAWPKRFGVANWGLIAAYNGDLRVGGAVIAHRTAKLHMLDGRDDLAALWDLRVRLDTRGTGVGSALFAAVERWARARGCAQIKVVTQNTNVPACRFYVRMPRPRFTGHCGEQCDHATAVCASASWCSRASVGVR